MLRADNSDESSIATEDALRYLRAAKFNSSKAIEIYKNYQVLEVSFKVFIMARASLSTGYWVVTATLMN